MYFIRSPWLKSLQKGLTKGHNYSVHLDSRMYVVQKQNKACTTITLELGGVDR